MQECHLDVGCHGSKLLSLCPYLLLLKAGAWVLHAEQQLLAMLEVRPALSAGQHSALAMVCSPRVSA